MQTETLVRPASEVEPVAVSPVESNPPSKPVVVRPTGGIRYHFGLQAFIDMMMSKRMIEGQGGQLVQLTFVPMIRIASDDPDAIDREYLEIRSRREKVRFWDSPRVRWRKIYGDFVREMEWALCELRKHFTQAQYEHIVVDTVASIARQDSQKEMDFLNRQSEKARQKREQNPGKTDEPGRLRTLMLEIFDPSRFAAFLVGESEITEMDEEAGTATMEVPNCAWHTCPAPESLANPSSLPEQGCLLICKGVFENIFDGQNGVKMEFDPHLPETSCTIRLQA